MRSIVIVSLAALVCLAAAPALAGDGPTAAPAAEADAAAKCPHGVKQTVCTRCNPKLEAVFKAKGDWCAEHSVPESQCAKCNPELAKQGVE